MESTSFMKVDEVAQELGVSKSYAYKIVQKLNAELKEKGFRDVFWVRQSLSRLSKFTQNPVKRSNAPCVASLP